MSGFSFSGLIRVVSFLSFPTSWKSRKGRRETRKSRKGRRETASEQMFPASVDGESCETTRSKWRQRRNECFCRFIDLNRSQWVTWLLCSWETLRAQQLGSGGTLRRGSCSQGTGTHHWLHHGKWENGLARSTGHDSHCWTWISAYGSGKPS